MLFWENVTNGAGNGSLFTVKTGIHITLFKMAGVIFPARLLSPHCAVPIYRAWARRLLFPKSGVQMAKKTANSVRVFGVELRFADGTPVSADMFENESSQAAMDRADAIDGDELDEEIAILDALRIDPSRADELADKGGISYPLD